MCVFYVSSTLILNINMVATKESFMTLEKIIKKAINLLNTYLVHLMLIYFENISYSKFLTTEKYSK